MRARFGEGQADAPLLATVVPRQERYVPTCLPLHRPDIEPIPGKPVSYRYLHGKASVANPIVYK